MHGIKLCTIKQVFAGCNPVNTLRIGRLLDDSLLHIYYAVRRLSAMPFALTTGQEWVFGIVDTSVPDNIRCIKMSKVIGISTLPSRATIRSMLKLILFWVSNICVSSPTLI
jgi:hypothetical protein